MTITIKYGDTTFFCEGDHDDVCKAIVDGKPLDAWRIYPDIVGYGSTRVNCRITFFGDPDWVAVEL